MAGLYLVFSAIAVAIVPMPDEQADRAAITELLEATVRTINEQDLNGNKRLFAEDGDHINPMGAVSRGPEAVASMMAEAFKQFGPWKTSCRALMTRFLEPNVAIEIREWKMVKPPANFPVVGPTPELLVHIKHANKWKILAARPLIPFRADQQVLPSKMATAAGFSDPEFVEEVKGWQGEASIAENAVVISGLGNIYRGRADVQEFYAKLREGRQSLVTEIRSARRIGENVAIVDIAFEAKGKWTPPNLPVLEGTVRGTSFAVYTKKDGKWVLQAGRSMIPFVPKP